MFSISGHVMIYKYAKIHAQVFKHKHKYSRQRVSELEISQMTLMIKGLNQNVPLSRVQYLLEQAFVFDPNQQRRQSVRAQLGQSIQKSGAKMPLLDQRKTGRIFVKHINISGKYNKIWAKKAQDYKNNLLRQQKIELLMEQDLSNVLSKLEQELQDLKRDNDLIANDIKRSKLKVDQKQNFGVAFIIFNIPDGVQEFIKDFQKVKQKPVANSYDEINIQNWSLSQAPCPSDIIWENLDKQQNFGTILNLIWLYILMFIICSFLVTPNFIYAYLEPYVEELRAEASNPIFISLLVMIQPSVTFMVNFVFVPTLVYFFSGLMGFPLKSLRYRYSLFWQLLFVIIFTVLIPITNKDSIESFWRYLAQTDVIKDLYLEIGRKFLESQDFFMTYIIQLTFVSNSFAMLDLAHWTYLKVTKGGGSTNAVKDDWYFDYAYFFAFNLSAFIIVLVFSVSAPLISILGLCYFTIRHLVDKYNFLYLYPKEFDSNGGLSLVLPRYLAFALFFFQVCMCGLLTSLFGRQTILIISIGLVGIEMIYLIIILNWGNIGIEKEEAKNEVDQVDEELREPLMGEFEDNRFCLRRGEGISNLGQRIPLAQDKYRHPFQKFISQYSEEFQ
ncbi:hypothetical protein FGO68_gene13698 [Halteria grandinella]|uniref:CSC1/OSCA1-like 7TM region domain-containing protein n=1 Tax=Halteria grandinella TaxID=5974 RepID=A0A8J8T737_HALGN|nr:hypothetical protein FGO68_gene13698 [Halteria grandinella]